MRCDLSLLFLLILSPLTAFSAEPFAEDLRHWTAHPANPVFTAAGPDQWDARLRERGWVLFDREAKAGSPAWHLWYTGYDGTPAGRRKLGYATSADGLKWTRHPGNPLYDQHWVEDMMIVRHNGTFFMFAEGQDDQAHLLRSGDGITWTRAGQLDVRKTSGEPIDPGPYGTPVGWFENGRWYLFYERRDLGIWLATSSDMKIWRNVRDEPVLSPGPEPYDQDLIAMNQVIRHEGRYYATLHGSKRGTKLWSSGLAVSDDLIHWTKYAGNPLFPVEANKSSGVLVHDGDRWRLYTMHDQVHVHFQSGR